MALAEPMFAESRSATASSCLALTTSLPTPPTPFAVTTGDFNGDGNPDLAVANRVADNVSVFFGNGTGGFGAGANYPVGSGPIGIAAADFNGDGRTDIAVANFATLGLPTSGTADVSVLLGTGGGNFAPAQHFGIGNSGSHPSSIAAADFNRDGRIDLALGNYGLSAVSVLIGNGAGSFSLAGTFPLISQNLFSIAVGDFDRDSNPDVAATLDFLHSVMILLGTGTGALGNPTQFPAGPLAIAVAVGDLNADGKEDLAVADQGGFVSILLGNGLGGFGPFTSFAVGLSPRGIVLADFDLDGKLDAAVTNNASSNVSVLLGNGLGGLGAATNTPVGTAPIGLAAGDFDCDGLPDLAVANIVSNSLSILINSAPVVVPASLPSGTVGTPYTPVGFGASGGTALPFSFSLSGALPPGLTFDSTLSGVPNRAGVFSFGITVTDGAGCSSTRSYTLSVARANTTVAFASSPNPSLPGQAIRLTATVTVSTGSVFFHDALDLIGTALVVDGVATLEVSGLASGIHLLTAAYSGDENFNPSNSPILTQIVSLPEIPTLGAAGLTALALLLAATALVRMRPRA